MTQEFNISLKVKAQDEANAKKISKVVKNFVKAIPEEKLLMLAAKIEGDKDFFKNLTPYLSML